MLTIKRGETKQFTFDMGSVSGTNLGTPTVVVSQDTRTFPLTLISQSGSQVVVSLTASVSILLVAGLETVLQLSWNDGSDNIVVFPSVSIEVQDQMIPISFDSIIVEDPEPDPVVTIEDQDYDSLTGGEAVEYVEFSEDGEDDTIVGIEKFEDVEYGEDGEIIEDGTDIEED